VAGNGQRVFAIVPKETKADCIAPMMAATWKRITNDQRIQGNGYFSKVFLDRAIPTWFCGADVALSLDGWWRYV